MRRIPFHVPLVSIYPVIALLGANILEVQPVVAIRPALISMAGAAMMLGLLRLITRDWLRAGLIATFLLLLFFSYGHLYEYLQANPVFGITLGRHRYLTPFYAVMAVSGIALIFRIRDRHPITGILNVVSIGLLMFPIYQLVTFSASARPAGDGSLELPETQALTRPTGSTLPDVYYIVLDTYMRSDAMRERFNYDNQPFMDDLRSQGFYVAECARSNYSYTLASITSAINMTYLPTMEDTLAAHGIHDQDIWILLKNNRVRNSLEDIGYSTVAFQTTYAWSEMTDADLYMNPEQPPLGTLSMTPFESMLLDTTAAVIISDARVQQMTKNVDLSTSQYAYHVETIRYTLRELPEVANVEGNKFVFAHILVPHMPYIFNEDGTLQTDPGFYSNKSRPIDDTYESEGYVDAVKFINRELSSVVKKILANSDTPPIIVIHGDHGRNGDNRLKILEAVYLPDGYEKLYPSITPVNLFRIIFNEYFGASYSLLPDISYLRTKEGFEVVPENAPECLP